MANDFSAIRVKQLAASAVGALRANHVMAGIVTRGRDIDPLFTSGRGYANIGNTMVIEIEPTLVATVHNPAGNSAQSVAPTSAELTLDTILTVDTEISSQDLSTMRESSIANIGVAAARALDKKLDQVIKDKAILTPYYYKQDDTATKKNLLQLFGVLNSNLCPTEQRSIAMDVNTNINVLGIDNFLDADKRGDGGRAFKEAIAGYAMGAQFLLDQNVLVEQTPADEALAINNTGGYSAGSQVAMAFDGGSSSDLEAGDMVKIAGTVGTHYYVVAAVTFGVAGTSDTLRPAGG